jgi:formate hydrogenlyase transcriptional activator
VTPRPCPKGGEARYRLLLQVAEAASSQLELAGVLEAVERALRRFVPVDAVAVVSIDGNRLRPHALHVARLPRRKGEPVGRTLERAIELTGGDPESLRGAFPLKGSATEFIGRTGRAYVCQDLQEERLFVEDERLLSFGVRSYVRAPLFVRERLLGSITFSRTQSRRFEPEEVEILEELSRPLANAVANSLAYEEIAKLRDRLHEENLVLKEEIDRQLMFEEIVGASPALRRVLEKIGKVARTDATVLITGETGTGKELVARAIHRRSRRASRALIRANLAALPDTLLASELFGHEKGAFTGALRQRIGRFELAHGGSIFLDEVGELPEEMQLALLRVLQDGEFERVGGTRTLVTDARVIAATNRDLAAAMAAGRFRSDLYYRLNVFPIDVPPLRERRDDVPILVEYFVSRHSARLGKKICRVSRATMNRFLAYDWPGNVRELQNVVERAVILSEGDSLELDEGTLPGSADSVAAAGLADQERGILEAALSAAGGRVSGPGGAAARLKIPATTLESKIRRLGIDKYRFRRPSHDIS